MGYEIPHDLVSSAKSYHPETIYVTLELKLSGAYYDEFQLFS